MKHTWITRLLSAIFPYKIIINCDRDPYLVRWYVFKTKYLTLFIHKFIRSDEDRALHNHPWPFLVVPIWRGYVEHSDRIDTCWLCDNRTGILPESIFGPGKICSECNGSGTLTKHTSRRVYPILGTRYRGADFRHRVELLDFDCPICEGMAAYDGKDCVGCNMTGSAPLPAWSLFFHFQRVQEWGFFPPTGFVHWKDWWSDKCGGDDL